MPGLLKRIKATIDALLEPGAPERPAQPTGKIRRALETAAFPIAVLLICGGFAAIQFLYVGALPLAVDEFVQAYDSYRPLRATPYVDYVPYKTVIGYYPQALLLWLADDTWSGLMLVRQALVILNTLMLAVGAFALRTKLRGAAVIGGLLLMVGVSTFIERSAELRVDMMTAWVGFGSLLLLFRKRALWAGLLAGVSFLVSQKGIYFCAAGFLAVATRWAVVKRDRAAFGEVWRYSVTAVAPLIVYVLVWGFVADFGTVLKAIFLSHEAQIFVNPHGDIRALYWSQSVWRNLFYYGTIGVALWRLDIARRADRHNRDVWLALVYGVCVALACGIHPKPWPYFIVLLFPTMFVVQSLFLDREIEAGNGRPLLFGMTPLVFVAFLALGLVVPLQRMEKATERDIEHQIVTLSLVEHALQGSETYLAGVNYLYRRDQAMEEFSVFDNIASKAMKKLDSKKKRWLMQKLRSKRLKLYVRSYRTGWMPRKIKSYLKREFCHLGASVYIYCPTVEDREVFSLKFAGTYRLNSKVEVEIDGEVYQPKQLLELNAGRHRCVAEDRFRLKLLPRDWERSMGTHTGENRVMFMDTYIW